MTTSPGKRTLRLDLEYDGTDFVGWQVQARGRSVQGELQRALRALLQEEVTPHGSGRTDAGTHALGQVAHCHTGSTLPVERLLAGVNALLPPDVAVSNVCW
ncbi:MAG TPA: tRNA pseudouridine(38-40) synthase TruA, partial [Candidatus Handelsmanbacteria bacterium]|nr:tRNA pseudouridine(38-40) synthase TruA [Candidatus Handelsmanbacteria bacterium]